MKKSIFIFLLMIVIFFNACHAMSPQDHMQSVSYLFKNFIMCGTALSFIGFLNNIDSSTLYCNTAGFLGNMGCVFFASGAISCQLMEYIIKKYPECRNNADLKKASWLYGIISICGLAKSMCAYRVLTILECVPIT